MKPIATTGSILLLVLMQLPVMAYDQKSDLLEAAARGDLDNIKKLLNGGADVNTKDTTTGRTPLMETALWGRIEAAKLLLDKRADVKCERQEGSNRAH